MVKKMVKNISKQEVIISPSIICANMMNIEKSIRELENIGIQHIHIDLVDGNFSPSMPLGTELIKAARKITKLDFDAHIMVQDNELFIRQLVDIGVESVCFHCESTIHVERMLQILESNNVKKGIALNPATSLDVLEFVIEKCDYVLLMLISPGYAGNKDEKMVSYAIDKIKKCKELIQSKGCNTKIIVDGRVSIDATAELVAAGADVLVSGSTGLFKSGNTLAENMSNIEQQIKKGINMRG